MGGGGYCSTGSIKPVSLPETPVTLLKALADVRVEEDFPATLECEFSRQNVEVRWLKVKRSRTD